MKEFVVPHVELRTNIVEVVEEEIVTKTVEVPQVFTTRNVRYIPKIMCADASGERQRPAAGGLMQRMKTAQACIAELEREKTQLQDKLVDTLQALTETKEKVQSTQIANMRLEAK